MEHSADDRFIQHVLEWVEYVAIGIEVLAVAIITIAIAHATVSYLLTRFGHRMNAGPVGQSRRRIGEAMLLALEILVAADIIRTVILDLTLESIAVLSILVLIRTFLSWSLVVEIEGRWPWSKETFRSE